ncbi:TetR/AcrR family transcriptional regulator, partial [Haliscomenobacter sp.]|uniref:TetR/AcrR family transcriptional regulator n=1 Tax=Haliscomenobacter sp. TaxID=2717303 RepID=UPI0033652158
RFMGMRTAERKAKEKENLRALILQGAKRLFLEKGIEQTTIRGIAEEISYSVGTVYVYFKDKNAILHGLHSQGFSDLGVRFQVLFNVRNPMERLHTMGRVYLQFAAENPDMYNLMLNVKAPIEFLNTIHSEEWNEGKATFAALKTTVKDCMDAGHFKGHQLEPLAFMFWSLVHGMCSLMVGQRIKGVNLENPDDIVEQAYGELLKLIQNL